MRQVMKALVLLCSLIGVVHADEPPVPAPDPKTLTKLDTSKLEELFTKATKHYDLGEWDAAIAEFKQLYDLMPDPSFLFNIGQSYRQKGACRDATTAYRSYLRNASDDNRAKAEQFIKDLEPCVKVEEENARRLLPQPPPPPPPPVRPRLLKWGGIAAAGTGIVVVGTAVGFSLRARIAERDLEAQCVSRCTGGEIENFDRKGRSSERAAKVLYVVGGSLLAVGSAMAVYAITRSERVIVQPMANGAVLSFGGGF